MEEEYTEYESKEAGIIKFDLRDWLPNKDKAELGLDFTRVLNVSYAKLWQNNRKGENVDPTQH